MSKDLTYGIKLTGDVTGAQKASMAIDQLASKTGAARDVFEGMEAAAKGNVSALFSVARGAQGAWEAMASGNRIAKMMTLIGGAIGVVSIALDVLKTKIEEESKALEEAAQKEADYARARLKLAEQSADKRFSDELDTVKKMSVEYGRAAAAADDLAAAKEKAIKAGAERAILSIEGERKAEHENIRGQVGWSELDRTQHGILVDRNASMATVRAQTAAETGSIDARTESAREQVKLLDEEVARRELEKADVEKAFASRMAELNAKIRTASNANDTGRLLDLTKQKEDQQNQSSTWNDNYIERSVAIKEQRKKLLAEIETNAIERANAIAKGQAKVTEIDLDAKKKDGDAIAEEMKKQAQRQKDITALNLREYEQAIREESAARQKIYDEYMSGGGDLGGPAGGAEGVVQRADAEAATAREALLDPAKGKAASNAKKAKEKEERRIQRMVEAYEKGRLRGVQGDRVRDYLASRNMASQAKNDLENAQLQMAADTAESAQTLSEIKEKLDEVLQAS